MSEETGATGAPEGNEQTTEAPEEGGFKKAMLAERAARQAAEARIAEYEAAQEAAAAEAAARRGEFEQLYQAEKQRAEELAAKVADYTARETARLEAVKAANAERVAALPDHLRALIPEGLDIDAQAAQIARLEALAGEKTFPAGTRRGSGKEPPLVIPEACKAEAARHGKTPEHWFKTVWNLPHRRKARGEA